MTKNMKIRERKCRNNIGKMLSLMGFKDNNIAAAEKVRNMLAKLGEVEEKDTNKFLTTSTINVAAVHKNKNRSTIKRFAFKLGGKSCVLDQESPTSVIVPLEQPHSKTPVVSCNKNMELKDSRKIHPGGCGSKMTIVGDHEDDDIDILDSRKNVVCSKNPNEKKYSRNNIYVSAQNPSTISSRMNVDDQEHDVMTEFKNGEISDSRNNVVYSENPNFIMIHEELRINYNVKDFITGIGGTKATLFIEKRLTSTDVSDHHGRLLMPGKKLENSDKILTPNEMMILGRKHGNISVNVFDPQKCKRNLNLGRWSMGRNINYVLKKEWNELTEKNNLKEHMNIQVWSFRDVEENLCFAVVRV